MRTLGLIGGTTWVSTADYYRRLNEGVHAKLGGSNSAPLLMYSFNFAEVRACIDSGDWDSLTARLVDAGRRLVAAGAEGLMLCSNTTHVAADALREALDVPLLHIAEITAQSIARRGMNCVGLLGTRATMELPFFGEVLGAQGISVRTPDAYGREFVHRTIMEELGQNRFTDATRQRYLTLMDALRAEGTQGMALACTEIPLLIGPDDTSLPLFDTLALHARAGIDFMLDAGDT
ncbi:aspartate/glutamate racemase family protein [Oleiagrimonas sp. C23AA]|uniref:aspartate/glutamate racemase family protein n=1 Tax=Oleiagrimonas sp. C23AA TaxID=2719047 RepID=UPI0014239844|nr:aspartate/glutamate racemase family protein [Oleiagrimonas sp. C23AA]NII10044.1 aspartate/glutamate racemase family protein [Oleiagrimonas sp. C23AA]